MYVAIMEEAMKLSQFPERRVTELDVEAIERLVRSRTGGMIRGLRVEIGKDGVILSGRAPTYYAKQLATHAALDAAHDLSLTNDIQVI